MEQIVFDMEWNQPTNPDAPKAVRLSSILPFEIIQIGAVKLSTGETFKVTCQLQEYRVLSPRISRLTGIGKEDVKNGLPFPEAAKKFREFCGESPRLITWGFNDIPILRQNLNYYHLPADFLQGYRNLQIPFHQQFDPDGQMRGLSYAVEFFGIPDDARYHDSMADAAYTAAVARHIDLARAEREYPDYLLHFEGDGDQAFLDCLRYANYTRFPDVDQMLSDKRIRETPCPICGKRTKIQEIVEPSPGKQLRIIRCPQEGPFLVRLSWKHNRDGTVHVSKAVCQMDAGREAQLEKAREKEKKAKAVREALGKGKAEAQHG